LPIPGYLPGHKTHSHEVRITYVKGTATTYVPDDSTLAGVSLAASATVRVTSEAVKGS